MWSYLSKTIFLLFLLLVLTKEEGCGNIDSIEEKIQEYVNHLKLEKDAIKEFLMENNADRPDEETDLEEYVSHPVNSFNLLKRMVVSWSLFRSKMEKLSSETLGNSIEKMLSNSCEANAIDQNKYTDIGS